MLDGLRPGLLNLISTVVTCVDMKCLPERGGLHDQDYLYVRGIQILVEARNQKRARDEKAQEQKNKRRGGK